MVSNLNRYSFGLVRFSYQKKKKTVTLSNQTDGEKVFLFRRLIPRSQMLVGDSPMAVNKHWSNILPTPKNIDFIASWKRRIG
jgi:hypothetical protein